MLSCLLCFHDFKNSDEMQMESPKYLGIVSLDSSKCLRESLPLESFFIAGGIYKRLITVKKAVILRP